MSLGHRERLRSYGVREQRGQRFVVLLLLPVLGQPEQVLQPLRSATHHPLEPGVRGLRIPRARGVHPHDVGAAAEAVAAEGEGVLARRHDAVLQGAHQGAAQVEDLEPDLRAILEFGVESASTANTAIAMDNYSKDLMELQSKEGVKVHRTSKDILQGQLDAWDEIIPELEKDAFMKKVLDSQRAWVERVVFYELMNAPDYALAYDHYFPGKLKL